MSKLDIFGILFLILFVALIASNSIPALAGLTLSLFWLAALVGVIFLAILLNQLTKK